MRVFFLHLLLSIYCSLIDDTYYNLIIVMAAELVRAAESESESEEKPEKLR